MIGLCWLRGLAVALFLLPFTLTAVSAEEAMNQDDGSFATAAMEPVPSLLQTPIPSEGLKAASVDGVMADWYARAYVENSGHFCPSDFPDSHWSLPALCFQSCSDGYEGHLFPGIAVCAACPNGFQEVDLEGDGVICRR
ncbi:MAG: hypothetical protein ACPGOV_10120 [Magnetovibrionaceae bacterium]